MNDKRLRMEIQKAFEEGNLRKAGKLVDKLPLPEPLWKRPNATPDERLVGAVMEEDVEKAKLLLSEFTNPNAEDFWGNSVLILASRRGNREIVELLIEKRARINSISFKWMTPSDHAILHKRTEVIPILRKHGGKTFDELLAERL